eukprot:5419798-Heterocapsa_arctica.AAC.1
MARVSAPVWGTGCPRGGLCSPCRRSSPCVLPLFSLSIGLLRRSAGRSSHRACSCPNASPRRGCWAVTSMAG